MIKNKKNLKARIKKGIKIPNKFKWDKTSKKTFNFLENLGR